MALPGPRPDDPCADAGAHIPRSPEGSVCAACWAKYRGKRPVGFASDPVCAFPHGERFSNGNWRCASLDRLRDLVGEYAGDVERDGIAFQHNGDQKIATIIIHDGIDLSDYDAFPVALVVSWYKSRGRTGTIQIIFDDGTAIAPTESDVEAICAGYPPLEAARDMGSRVAAPTPQPPRERP